MGADIGIHDLHRLANRHGVLIHDYGQVCCCRRPPLKRTNLILTAEDNANDRASVTRRRVPSPEVRGSS